MILFILLDRVIKERIGLDKATVEWPDEDKPIEHEVKFLRPAPNPREKLKFGEEQVQCTEYIDSGETATIYRPRKNIPKSAPVRCTLSKSIIHMISYTMF